MQKSNAVDPVIKEDLKLTADPARSAAVRGVPLPCGGIEPAGFGLAGDHHVHPRRRGHFTPLR